MTEGSSTANKGIEIQVDLTKALTAYPNPSAGRLAVLAALNQLEAYILQANWPPA